MKRIPLLFLLIFVALSARQTTFAQDRAWAHDESIEQISEHVYHFGSDNQFGAYIQVHDSQPRSCQPRLRI